jgi:hypothetical protein
MDMMDYTTLFDAVLMENARREVELSRRESLAAYSRGKKVRQMVAVGLIKIGVWMAGAPTNRVPDNNEGAPALV